jgi:AraC-like DNA-binding protein
VLHLARFRPAARLDAVLSRRPRQLSYGGGGATTRLVCGYLACDTRLARMLLTGLPPVVQSMYAARRRCLAESSVHYARRSRSPAGGEGVLAKLAEVLFIEVLRLYMHEQGPNRWLAGVSDRTVGAALSALHDKPCHCWTLEELARTAGTSRSVLAERFQQLVGISPMQYLTQWRMLLAANLLRSSTVRCCALPKKWGTRRIRRSVGHSGESSVAASGVAAQSGKPDGSLIFLRRWSDCLRLLQQLLDHLLLGLITAFTKVRVPHLPLASIR